MCIRDRLKVNTTCGASNISFGLPNRNGFNGAFISMAIQAGMTSAITNPLHAEVVAASMGADVMLGKDPDCSRWIKQFREPAPEGATRGTGRRAGRLRRPAPAA